MSKINIVLEHPDFFVIEKPAGLACHGPNLLPNEQNLVELLAQENKPAFLCHRLDKATSGLLIVAKTAEAADRFRQLFEDNHIEKYYFALCDKKGKKKQGSIKGNIEKTRNGNRKLVFADAPKTNTQFFSFALPNLFSNTNNHSRAFIIKIIGGKTHQIRVALKANASPIMGDERYGGLPQARLCLHAYALRFSFNEESFCLLSEVDFLTKDLVNLENVFEHASKPWELKWPK